MPKVSRSASRTSGGFWSFTVLIGASLLLLAALTWQSVSAARSHVRIAENVLADYAELAAQQYVRNVKQYFGYWWSFQLGPLVIEHFESDPVNAGAVFSIPDESQPMLHEASRAIEAIFRVAPGQSEIEILQGHGLVDAHEFFRSLEENARRDGFLVSHMDSDGRNVLVVIYPVPGRPYWYGVFFNPRAVTERLRELFFESPLLPGAIAGHITDNEGIFIELKSPSGKSVFASSPGSPPSGPSDNAIMIEHIITDDYQGLFSDFRLTVALDPELADQLIIGGLPRSRLPALITLMVLTQLVLVTILRLLYKERSLARMRSDFVSRVSHEFRTPLTQIRMFAETLLLHREESQEDRDRQLRIINREARRLTLMVSNILTLAGRERRRQLPRLRPERVCNLLSEIIDDYRFMLIHSNTEIELLGCDSESRQIRAQLDAESFKQVLTNILDNACKYGPEDQVVIVEFSADDDYCRIAIEDQGPGVPDSEREKIWQLYYRMDREDRRAVNGTGIGLPIARELLEDMHGDCHVENSESGGARFILWLKRASS